MDKKTPPTIKEPKKYQGWDGVHTPNIAVKPTNKEPVRKLIVIWIRYLFSIIYSFCRV